MKELIEVISRAFNTGYLIGKGDLKFQNIVKAEMKRALKEEIEAASKVLVSRNEADKEVNRKD